MEEVFLTLNGRNKPGRQNEGGSFLRCPFCLSLPQRFAAFREACFSKCSGFMAFDEFPGCFQVGVRRSSGRIVFKNGVAETGGLPQPDGAGDDRLYSIWGRCRSTWSMTWRERLVRPSYMVISTPSCRNAGIGAAGADLRRHVQNLGQPFQTEPFALEGSQHFVAGGQGGGH